MSTTFQYITQRWPNLTQREARQIIRDVTKDETSSPYQWTRDQVNFDILVRTTQLLECRHQIDMSK